MLLWFNFWNILNISMLNTNTWIGIIKFGGHCASKFGITYSNCGHIGFNYTHTSLIVIWARFWKNSSITYILIYSFTMFHNHIYVLILNKQYLTACPSTFPNSDPSITPIRLPIIGTGINDPSKKPNNVINDIPATVSKTTVAISIFLVFLSISNSL